jgi:hypothetical protein
MINLLRWFTRIAGLGALVLGMGMWFGPPVIPLGIHMILGVTVALVLAILAVWSLAARVRIPAAIGGLAWAAATVYIGTVQDLWVGAGSHRLIEVIHPLLGIGAIGLAEMLAGGITRAGASRKP